MCDALVSKILLRDALHIIVGDTSEVILVNVAKMSHSNLTSSYNVQETLL